MKSLSINSMLTVIITIIVLQSVYFKFTGGAEMVYVFRALNVEPFGRYLSALMEFAACMLLYFQKTRLLGATLTMFLMLLAMLAHFCFLGLEVLGDAAIMFMLALMTFSLSSILIYRYREDCNFLSAPK